MISSWSSWHSPPTSTPKRARGKRVDSRQPGRGFRYRPFTVHRAEKAYSWVSAIPKGKAPNEDFRPALSSVPSGLLACLPGLARRAAPRRAGTARGEGGHRLQGRARLRPRGGAAGGGRFRKRDPRPAAGAGAGHLLAVFFRGGGEALGGGGRS